ncbi:hypothetical protein D3C78_354390 [compost metagenome]
MRQPLQHVAQPRIGLLAVGLRGLDQAVDLCTGRSTLCRVAEQPGLAPDDKRLYRKLCQVIVDRQMAGLYVAFQRVRSMNPTYHMMGQQVTVASLASSSTAEELRSRPPTMHTAGAQVRGAATYRAPGR